MLVIIPYRHINNFKIYLSQHLGSFFVFYSYYYTHRTCTHYRIDEVVAHAVVHVPRLEGTTTVAVHLTTGEESTDEKRREEKGREKHLS